MFKNFSIYISKKSHYSTPDDHPFTKSLRPHICPHTLTQLRQLDRQWLVYFSLNSNGRSIYKWCNSTTHWQLCKLCE